MKKPISPVIRFIRKIGGEWIVTREWLRRQENPQALTRLEELAQIPNPEPGKPWISRGACIYMGVMEGQITGEDLRGMSDELYMDLVTWQDSVGIPSDQSRLRPTDRIGF